MSVTSPVKRKFEDTIQDPVASDTEEEPEEPERPEYESVLEYLHYIIFTKKCEFENKRLPAIRLSYDPWGNKIITMVESLMESANAAKREEIRKLLDDHSDTDRRKRNLVASHRRENRKLKNQLENATNKIARLEAELELARIKLENSN